MSAECVAVNIPRGFKQTEAGIIPEDWDVRPAGEICKVNQGLQIAISNRLKIPSPNSKKYITIQYLNEGKEAEYIDKYSQAVCCNRDDVLMTRTGNTGIIITNVEGVFHNNFFKINYDKKLITKEHLVNFLRLEQTQKQILIKAGTSTIPDLNHSDFYSIYIVIPPLAEQEAIAEVLSYTDALINSLEQLIAKKGQIKQGAMQELLTGKRRLPGFEIKLDYKQTEIGIIPGDWLVKTIGELCSCFSGGTPSTSNPRYYGGNIAWISSGDLNNTRIKEVEGRITEEGLANSSAKIVKQGTLLLALYGATAGVSAVTEIKAAINQAVLAIIPKQLSIEYLFQFLRLRKDFYIKTFTQGGQPNFSGEIVKSFIIPFSPTKAEQEAIATILSDMDSEITALEEKLAKARRIKQGMMQELLTGRIRLI